jgi:hypothetical protein
MMTKPSLLLAPKGDEFADDLGQACPFPTRALPPPLRDVVKAVSELHRVPESLAACCALAVTSAAIGKGLKVSSIPGMSAPANLYLMVGARSGTGKSVVFETLTKPIKDCEKRLTDEWRNRHQPDANAEETDEQSEEPERVENGEAREAAPALVCENITSEALAMTLSSNHECLASMSADARDVMAIVSGRYGGRGDEALYLKAFSEDTCVINRASRPAIRLDSPNLTCLWLVQPDKIDLMFGEKFATEGGLLPRFLVCQANCMATPIDRERAPVDDEPHRAWEDLVKSLLTTYRLKEGRIVITPTDRAKKLLYDHYNGLIPRRNGDLQHIDSYVARWNEQAWRLALVLHAAQWGGKAASKQLSGKTAKSAIELADWFAGQQLAKLMNGREAAEQKLTDAVVKLLLAKPTGIKAKDIYRKHIVPTPEEAHTLLAQLEAKGLLAGQDVHPEGGGKPSRNYTVAAA